MSPSEQLLYGLASLPMPVAIVGAAHEGACSCHTGTLTYATYKPPTIATPLARTSRTWKLIEASGELSISILAETQADLAVRAARRGTMDDKFAEHGVPLLEPPEGRLAPAVPGAAAVLWCTLLEAISVGHYALCVAEIVAATHDDSRLPLLRMRREYRTLGTIVPVHEDSRYPL